jgi:hypothetical protein
VLNLWRRSLFFPWAAGLELMCSQSRHGSANQVGMWF